MAKDNKKNDAPKTFTPRKIEAPEGFESRNGDFVGFWDEELEPVMFGTPLEARMSDSKADSRKPSILITFKIEKDMTVASSADSGGRPVTAKAGDLVGVWSRPGMAALKPGGRHGLSEGFKRIMRKAGLDLQTVKGGGPDASRAASVALPSGRSNSPVSRLRIS